MSDTEKIKVAIERLNALIKETTEEYDDYCARDNSMFESCAEQCRILYFKLKELNDLLKILR